MYKNLTGDDGAFFDFDLIGTVGKEVLGVIGEWKEQLGYNRGLFDRYLRGILAAIVSTTDVCETAEKGFIDTMVDLRRLIQNIQRGKNSEAEEHPFYPQTKDYINTHNIPEDSLFVESCVVGLFPQYVAYASERFIEAAEKAFHQACDDEGLPEIREGLMSSEAEISEEQLQWFENILGQVLYALPPSSVFIQGMIDQITMSLLLQGEQHEGYIFMKLLKGEIYP